VTGAMEVNGRLCENDGWTFCVGPIDVVGVKVCTGRVFCIFPAADSAWQNYFPSFFKAAFAF